MEYKAVLYPRAPRTCIDLLALTYYQGLLDDELATIRQNDEQCFVSVPSASSNILVDQRKDGTDTTKDSRTDRGRGLYRDAYL